mgnify:CR=1 FL=1
MFCSNCGAEAEGNFCKNCGAPLPKEEPSTEKSNESIDAEYKVYDEEEDQKQKDKQKNVKVTIKNKRGGSSRNTTTTKRKRRSALSSGGDAVSNAASTAGNVVGKSVKTAGNILFTGLHWLCALLMIGIVLQIFKNVWNYTSVSTIMGLASSRVSSHSIRQNMEYFQIDPAFIIGHTEHITAVFILLDISAWKIVLHANLWRRFSVFLKIIPEHPLPQS